MRKAILTHLARAYSTAPLLAQIHVQMRARQCPFESVARHVPRDGTVLDIGVGHGIMLHVLHHQSNGRRLIGIDVAEPKLKVARSSVRNGENMAFLNGYLDAVPPGPIHCVTMMDSAYLIPEPDWQRLVLQLYRRLEPGGILLIKEITTSPWYKYMISYLQETFSVRIAGIHHGRGLYFRKKEALRATLSTAGFRVSIEDLSAGHPYAHVLYIARKARAAAPAAQ